MVWRTLARWGVRRTWKYNRYYADSATLAHAIHKKRLRQRAMRILSANTDFGFRLNNVLAPLAIDIVNQFNNSNTGTGQRAWPEVSGYPPVFGNYIGEIGHTGGGTYIWTGFSWEPAILGG